MTAARAAISGVSKVSRDIVASAYVARACRVVADAAEVLGRPTDAAHYAERADAVAAAFRAAYVTPAGRMMSDAPTASALAIGFALVTEPTLRQALGARLAERVRAAGYTIATGFVGTPLILVAVGSVMCCSGCRRRCERGWTSGWVPSLRGAQRAVRADQGQVASKLPGTGSRRLLS